MSKFVKHGAEGKESFVEVDILTPERTIVTIRRVINSDNKGSKWSLDNKPAKQADVKALVASLSIDVDNLCSFMPQDKVGNFSRCTPKEMLSQTLKAVQDPNSDVNLSDEQRALSQIQDAKEEYRRKRDAKQTALDASKRELEGMRAELDRMQRREEKQELLKKYEVRLLAVEIGELEGKITEKELVVEEKTNLLKAEQAKIAPLEELIRDLTVQQTARDRDAAAAQEKQQLIDDALRGKKDVILNCDNEVDLTSNALRMVETSRQAKEEQRATVVHALEAHQHEEAQARELLPTLQAKLAANEAASRQLWEERTAAEEVKAELERRINELRGEMTNIIREQSSLQDFKQIFREKLSRHSDPMMREAGQAMDWLAENQDRLRRSGQLRSEVWGPVAMYCNVADPACAAMLEKAIPMNRLMSFVVDNDNDRNFLKHQLREVMHLKTDIITMKKVNTDVRRPYTEQQVQQLGMKGYLCDQLECPDIIRALFYSFHTLQRVLWARGVDNLSQETQVRLCQQDGGFKLYIHEVNDGGRGGSSRQGQNQGAGMTIVEYNGKRSRNPNAAPSTSSIGITPKNIVTSQSGGDDVAERRAALDRQHKEAGAKLNQAGQEKRDQEARIRQLYEQINKLKAEKDELRASLKVPDSLRQKVIATQRALASLDKELATLSDRTKKEAAYTGAIDSLLGAVRNAVKLAQRSTAQRVDRAVTASLQGELQRPIAEHTQAVKEARRGVQDLNKELNAAVKERTEAQNRFEEKEAELNVIIDRTGKTTDQYAADVYTKIVQECPEDTVALINARVDALNDEINRIADNPQLQQRFEEVTQNAQRLEGELKQASTDLDNAEESLAARSHKWSDTVSKIADKLNIKFAEFMQNLQLDGSVQLIKVGKFDDYELQLNVRFRDGQDLSPLDGNKHSGGERAVSTVMFLMALQDMTTSPFRVVDEINQGMDESNERLVFDRIVKSCCGDASKPQYFLVTPKLLQGLGAMNNEDVTVLLVWNGPGTLNKWTFEDVLRKLSHGEYMGASGATQSNGNSAHSSGAHANGSSSSSNGRHQKRRVVESEDEEEEEEIERKPVIIKKQKK